MKEDRRMRRRRPAQDVCDRSKETEMKTEETLAEILAQNKRFLEKTDRKYGGPPPPLTEEELDASETEIHNHIRRRGQPAKSTEEIE
jgi:hypothetical protein